MSFTATEKVPDAWGHFGPYGGRYVPETLMHPLQELEEEYCRSQQDPGFQREFEYYLKEFCGRPTPLYYAERLTRELGGAKIYLKREDLLHTGAHKINNCIGQILLARRMGKTRIIAETGAGQHGVATATVAAMFGLKCVIYMGAVDCERQALNVFRMKMLGAEVVPVKAGQQTLKEAINEAMRDWVTNVRTTHYILGTVYGAHPYPLMVRNFQRVIGDEARRQILEKEERLPDVLIACVGGHGEYQPTVQLTEAHWHLVIEVNLTATFLTVKSILPGMSERRAGSIVTVASSAGRFLAGASAASAPYAAAKAGECHAARRSLDHQGRPPRRTPGCPNV